MTSPAGAPPHVDLVPFASFRQAVAPWLAADPVNTNVMATVSGSAEAGATPGAVWIVVRSGEDVVGAAFRTPPHPLNLPPMPDGAVAAVADALHARGVGLDLLSGSVRSTAVFAARWNALTGDATELTTEMGVHVLGELVPPAGVPGRARTAGHADLNLVGDWLAAFDQDAHGSHIPRPRDPAETAARVADGRIVLWVDDGKPVSLAGWNAPRAGVGRVGPVYTPPEHRRHGYAAGATSAATRALLAAGAEHVMLFTDLANRTSNGVYARLGYRRVGEASEWTISRLSPGR